MNTIKILSKFYESQVKKKYFNNVFFYNGIIIVSLFYLIFDVILDLTIWGVIKKVLLFENNLLTREYILEKKFPLFSFTQNLGFPILAESQASIFEPISLITNLILGPLTQINASYFIHKIIFFCGLFILLTKIYKISTIISFSVSIITIFSNKFLADAIHANSINTLAYFPLSIFLIEKYLFNNKNLLFFLLFSVVIFFQLLAGHYQLQLYSILFYCLYFFIKLFLNYKEISHKKIFFFIFTLVFGFSLSALQLIPSLDLLLLGERSKFEATFSGSTNYSAIFVYYKSLSKQINWIEGSAPTIGYISIFIYSINQIIVNIRRKKFKIDKYFLIFISIFIIFFILSLGQNLPSNNIIYELIPFLKGFRFPSRLMIISSFCTIFLVAIALNNLIFTKKKINNLEFIFLIIFIIYLLPLLHFWEYLSTRKIDLYYWKHAIFIFYPLLIVVFSYFYLKYFLNLFSIKITAFIIILLSLTESFGLLNAFQQYSTIFEKGKIIQAQNYGSELCLKYKTNSLNIVGELKDTEEAYLIDYKKFKYYSPIGSKYCHIFYHHSREDVTKIGLGYHQSSLATFQMAHLSELQQNFVTKEYGDHVKNRFKYIASFVQEFTNSKVLYVDQKNNILKDDLIKINKTEIYNFIIKYNFEHDPSFMEIIKNKFNKEILYLINYTDFKKYFPSIHSSKIKIINFENNKFLPIWQSNDFYYTKNNQLYNLEKFSFGHKVENNTDNFKVYYIPFSFIIGLSITIISITIWLFGLLFLLVKLKK